MTTLHIGAVVERPPGSKYAEALAYAELAPRSPLPRPKTLAKVPRNLPGDFVLNLTAPPSSTATKAGPLRMNDELRQSIEWLGSAAQALGAQAIVVPTPTDVRTGPQDRARLTEYFRALHEAAPDIRLAWEPSGLWEAEDARPFADSLDVLYAFDPLEVQATPASAAYFRVRGIGARTRLGEGTLTMVMDAIEALGDPEAVYVSLISPRSVQAATRLRKLVAL